MCSIFSALSLPCCFPFPSFVGLRIHHWVMGTTCLFSDDPFESHTFCYCCCSFFHKTTEIRTKEKAHPQLLLPVDDCSVQ